MMSEKLQRQCNYSPKYQVHVIAKTENTWSVKNDAMQVLTRLNRITVYYKYLRQFWSRNRRYKVMHRDTSSPPSATHHD